MVFRGEKEVHGERFRCGGLGVLLFGQFSVVLMRARNPERIAEEPPLAAKGNCAGGVGDRGLGAIAVGIVGGPLNKNRGEPPPRLTTHVPPREKRIKVQGGGNRQGGPVLPGNARGPKNGEKPGWGQFLKNFKGRPGGKKPFWDPSGMKEKNLRPWVSRPGSKGSGR